MRKVIWLLLALAAVRLLPRALRREAELIETLTALLAAALAMATTNTAKAYETETRVGLLETRAGNLEQGIVPNLQPSSTIGQIQTLANAALPAAGGTVTGTLTIDGDCGIHGNVTVVGTASTNAINAAGDITAEAALGVHGNLTVDGTASTNAINAAGNITAEASLGVHGNTTILGTLGVDGYATLSGGYGT